MNGYERWVMDGVVEGIEGGWMEKRREEVREPREGDEKGGMGYEGMEGEGRGRER
jgi:hypothetical protein